MFHGYGDDVERDRRLDELVVVAVLFLRGQLIKEPASLATVLVDDGLDRLEEHTTLLEQLLVRGRGTLDRNTELLGNLLLEVLGLAVADLGQVLFRILVLTFFLVFILFYGQQTTLSRARQNCSSVGSAYEPALPSLARRTPRPMSSSSISSSGRLFRDFVGGSR